MREKIVLGCRAVAKGVRLPDGTSFVCQRERISRSSFPGNIRVTRTRTVGPRNRRAPRIKKKRVRLNLAKTLMMIHLTMSLRAQIMWFHVVTASVLCLIYDLYPGVQCYAFRATCHQQFTIYILKAFVLCHFFCLFAICLFCHAPSYFPLP